MATLFTDPGNDDDTYFAKRNVIHLGRESTADFRAAGRTSGSLAGRLRGPCGELAGTLRGGCGPIVLVNLLYSDKACQILTEIARGPQSCLSTHRQICYLALGLQLYRLQTTADEPAVRPAIGRRSVRKLPATSPQTARSPQARRRSDRWIHGLTCTNATTVTHYQMPLFELLQQNSRWSDSYDQGVVPGAAAMYEDEIRHWSDIKMTYNHISFLGII